MNFQYKRSALNNFAFHIDGECWYNNKQINKLYEFGQYTFNGTIRAPFNVILFCKIMETF